MRWSDIFWLALVFWIVFLLGLSTIISIVNVESEHLQNDTEKQLETIADTTLNNKEDWEPTISEDKLLGPDLWGTDIRLLYLKVPDMVIVVALSAGPDHTWDTDDDIVATAFDVKEK